MRNARSTPKDERTTRGEYAKFMRLSESKLRTAAISDKFLHRTPVSTFRFHVGARRGNGVRPSITSFIYSSIGRSLFARNGRLRLFAFDGVSIHYRVSCTEFLGNRETIKKGRRSCSVYYVKILALGIRPYVSPTDFVAKRCVGLIRRKDFEVSIDLASIGRNLSANFRIDFACEKTRFHWDLKILYIRTERDKFENKTNNHR